MKADGGGEGERESAAAAVVWQYSRRGEGRLSTGTEQFQGWMCFGIRASANSPAERRRDSDYVSGDRDREDEGAGPSLSPETN